MLGAIQTTRTNSSETQPSNNGHIHQSQSAPEFKSVVKTDAPEFTRATHSESDLRTPSRRILFTEKHKTTADSFRTAALYFDTMRTTISDLQKGQSSHVSIDKIKARQFRKLNDLKYDRRLQYPNRVPQCWRDVQRINSEDGITSKVSELLLDALVSLIAEKHDESTSVENTEENLANSGAEIDDLTRLSKILTMDRGVVVLALAECFEDNKSKFIGLPTNPLPEVRTDKVDTGGKKTILSPAAKATKKHFDELYDTARRLKYYEEIPAPGQYYIVRISKDNGGNPGTDYRAMEKIPSLTPEEVRNYLINTPEEVRNYLINPKKSAFEKKTKDHPAISEAKLNTLNEEKELHSQITVESLESRFPKIFLDTPKRQQKIQPYISAISDKRNGKAHYHRHEDKDSITVYHLGTTTVTDKATGIKTITEPNGTVRSEDKYGNDIPTPEMKKK